MKPITLISFIILTCFYLSSCKKDKLSDAGGTTLDKIVVRGTSLGGEYTYTYSYDQQNRLISMSSMGTPGGSLIVSDVFTYDAQGKLATHTAPKIFSYTFTYDANGRIIKKIGTPILANLQVDDYSYSYDAQNRPIADTQYYAQSNAILAYNTYTYDAAGNISEVNNFAKVGMGPFVSTGKASFTFDNKLNPYYNLRSVLYYTNDNTFSLGRNNVSQITTASSVSSWSFSYYSNDLPQAQTSSNTSSAQTITTTFFFKQP